LLAGASEGKKRMRVGGMQKGGGKNRNRKTGAKRFLSSNVKRER